MPIWCGQPSLARHPRGHSPSDRIWSNGVPRVPSSSRFLFPLSFICLFTLPYSFFFLSCILSSFFYSLSFLSHSSDLSFYDLIVYLLILFCNFLFLLVYTLLHIYFTTLFSLFLVFFLFPCMFFFYPPIFSFVSLFF